MNGEVKALADALKRWWHGPPTLFGLAVTILLMAGMLSLGALACVMAHMEQVKIDSALEIANRPHCPGCCPKEKPCTD